MNKFKHTFWFYAQGTFKKVGLIILSLTFLATVGMLFAIDFFGGSYMDIAIVQDSDVFVIPNEALESLSDRNFHFVATIDEARAMFESEAVSDVFMIHGEVFPELTAITTGIMADMETQMFLMQILTEFHLEHTINRYNVPIDVATQLLTPVTLHLEADDLDTFLIMTLLDTLIPSLVMMPVMLMGGLIANSVTSEKASRVMEVMLGKVHPTITMSAKVMARFVSMISFILMVVLGFVAAHLLGIFNFSELLNSPEIASLGLGDLITIDVIILTIIVVLVAFFVFIFIFAGAGAVATSVESLNKVLTPLTLVVLAGLFLPLFLEIDSLAMDILVYVPLVSPFVIVQRFIHGSSGIIEVVISIAIMIAFAFGTLIISARVYKNGISHTAEKITMKDLKMLLQK